jgi:hypothetical protein
MFCRPLFAREQKWANRFALSDKANLIPGDGADTLPDKID